MDYLLEEPGAPEGACRHLFLGPISLWVPFPCAYHQRALAPDERPGSLGPEMELRK